MKRTPLARKTPLKRKRATPYWRDMPADARLRAMLPDELPPGTCWEWQGHRSKEGYAEIRWAGGRTRAHRLAWMIAHGVTDIPDGMCVCHTCDNPPCCNPEHLFLGTHGDNARDRSAKGRSARNATAAKLTAADVQEIRSLRGRESHRTIAARFGIHPMHVHRLWRRENWRGVA